MLRMECKLRAWFTIFITKPLPFGKRNLLCFVAGSVRYTGPYRMVIVQEAAFEIIS